MRIERIRNATNNLKWGLFERIVSLLVPFVCRTAIIRIFGINYLGLNSLFTSILSALNLTELGFGSAIVYFMYRAVAEEDNDRICALLHYIKRVYWSIGLIILILGLALLPFLRYFIKADVPTEVNIYVLYLLMLAGTVQSYLLFAYEGAIFRANQRLDVLSKISSVVVIVEKVLQLAFIFIFRNYYLYIATTIIAGILHNVLIHLATKKWFPLAHAFGNLAGEEKQDIRRQVRGLFMYKVGNVVNGSADSVVVSAFLGLTIMGRYGNYYYVISFLMGLLGIYYSSLRAGIGNSIVLESVEKNFRDFKTLQFAQNWIVNWSTVCLFCLFQDFISIYAGEQNQLPFGCVVCLCLYFWIWKIQDVVYTFKEAAGMWDQDRYRPIIGAAINLVLNVFFVRFIGLYGVILSTVFVLVVLDLPWASRVLFKQYFKSNVRVFYRIILIGAVQLIVMLLPTYWICTKIITKLHLTQMIIKAMVCLIVPNVLYFAMNFRKYEFDIIMKKVKSILKR